MVAVAAAAHHPQQIGPMDEKAKMQLVLGIRQLMGALVAVAC